MVDDFSSKLDLPQEIETVETIGANHMRMTKYSSKDDEGYRAIAGVLKAYIGKELESQQAPPGVAVNVVDATCT